MEATEKRMKGTSNVIEKSKQITTQASSDTADVLLMTATEVETRAVRSLILQQGGIFERRLINGQPYFDLGVIGDARVFLVQSEMGAGGPGGATLVVYEGIKALSPSTVVMVGIAFGLRPGEQKLGDILVARQLVGYQLQKVDTDRESREQIKARGDRPHATPRLLSRFQAGVFDWSGSKVHFGLMLSGDILVNNINFRDKLLRIEPEAIGGEMEGTGVYSAAFREKVDWILVKAICDWADGNKDENKDMYQRQAAENAVRFTFHVLRQGRLAGTNIGPSASSQETVRAAPLSRPAIGTTLCTYDIHSSYVVAVAWEPGDNRIASAGGDGTVRVWEAVTGHTLLTYRGHPPVFKSFNMAPTIYTIAWSPEGLRLASAGVGTDIHVWDVATGQDIVTYTGHSGLLPDVWALAWSPQGDRIASTCGDKTIRLWDATTGKRIATFQTSSDWVYMIAWSPDGRCLALANGNATAEILDASTGRMLLTYRGHHQGVRDIAWSPDGSRLATSSNDTTVQIWDATTGTCLYTHEEHAAWTTSVAWSPDGTRIASASNDRTVQVWQAT